ncbi:hypothetical protein BP6252_06639 [Coleophoma cylindrospora]|uniref:Transcription factor domain-containing protein n=1 Tax=Coleophoma cylindrospora TaxID=1849047 RepID=A0A3D8RN54_9HELO|nr:hypothetical protein BP6252_06639 [Coleophoma cylindrospora]
MTQDTASHPKSIHRPRIHGGAKDVAMPAPCYSYPLSKPSDAHGAMTELFVGRFITSFCGTHTSRSRKPWMMLLPDSLANDVRWPTIRLSLQAASLAQYAVEAAEPGATVQSREMYVQALKLHRRFIRENMGAAMFPSSIALTAVVANVILAFFEAIRCSHVDAYGFHVSAAAEILEIIGPEQCRSGLLNQLFFTLRSQMAFVSFISHAPFKLATRDWTQVLFSDQTAKPMSERVMDSIIALLQIASTCDTAESFDVQDVKVSMFYIRSQLEELWTAYSDRGTSFDQALISVAAPHSPINHNPVTILTTVYFNCASLILSHLSATYMGDHLADVTSIASCASILSGIEYLEKQSIGCAYMRMMLPLALVSLKSPEVDQQRVARAKIQTWHAQRLMSGLCMVSLHHLDNYRNLARGDSMED